MNTAPQTAEAGIGHNSTSYLEMIESDPGIVFRDEQAVDSVIAEIKAQIDAAKIDLTTTKGRKEIASRAAQIARRKSAIDESGKQMNEEHRKAINAVDAVRRKVRNALDELRDRARKPLDDWEAEQEAKQQRINDAAAEIDRQSIVPAGASTADVDAMRKRVDAIEITPELFGMQADDLIEKRDRVIQVLTEARKRIAQEEADRAELARLRAEREEAERREREAEEARRREEAERQRAEQEKQRAAKAAQEAADRAAEEERRKAQEAAEAERRQHEESLAEERRRAEAAEKEIAEQRRREEAERAEEERRRADQEHRGKIMGEAKKAIMAHADVDEPAAKKIVLAIVAEAVPHVRIRF